MSKHETSKKFQLLKSPNRKIPLQFAPGSSPGKLFAKGGVGRLALKNRSGRFRPFNSPPVRPGVRFHSASMNPPPSRPCDTDSDRCMPLRRESSASHPPCQLVLCLFLSVAWGGEGQAIVKTFGLCAARLGRKVSTEKTGGACKDRSCLCDRQTPPTGTEDGLLPTPQGLSHTDREDWQLYPVF